MFFVKYQSIIEQLVENEMNVCMTAEQKKNKEELAKRQEARGDR